MCPLYVHAAQKKGSEMNDDAASKGLDYKVWSPNFRIVELHNVGAPPGGESLVCLQSVMDRERSSSRTFWSVERTAKFEVQKLWTHKFGFAWNKTLASLDSKS